MYTRYVIRPGDSGIGVNKMQGYLNIMQENGFINTKLLLDGQYGSKTSEAVKEFQRYAGLAVDGVIGSQTWDSLVNKLRDMGVVTNIPVASPTFFLGAGNSGLDVFKMQEYLNELSAVNPCLRPVPVDGNFGNRTIATVSQFQYLYGLTIDGRIGKATWDAIVNERNKIKA